MKKVKNLTLNKFESIEDIPFVMQGSRHYYKSLDSVNLYEIFIDKEDYENAQTYYSLIAKEEESSLYCELPTDKIEMIDENNNTKQGYLLKPMAIVTLSDLVCKDSSIFEFNNVLKLMEKIAMCIHFLHHKFNIGHGNLHDQNIKIYYKGYNANTLLGLLASKNINDQDLVVKVSQFSPDMTELSLAFEPPELLLYNIGLVGNPDNTIKAQKRDIWDLGLLFYELLTGGINYVSGIHINSVDGDNELLTRPDEHLNWNLLCNINRIVNLEESETYQKLVRNERDSLREERLSLAIEYMGKNTKNQSSIGKIKTLVKFISEKMLLAAPEKRASVQEIKKFLAQLE